MKCPYCEYDPKLGWFKFMECRRLYNHLVSEHIDDQLTDKQHAGNIIVCQRNRERNGFGAIVDETD